MPYLNFVCRFPIRIQNFIRIFLEHTRNHNAIIVNGFRVWALGGVLVLAPSTLQFLGCSHSVAATFSCIPFPHMVFQWKCFGVAWSATKNNEFYPSTPKTIWSQKEISYQIQIQIQKTPSGTDNRHPMCRQSREMGENATKKNWSFSKESQVQFHSR